MHAAHTRQRGRALVLVQMLSGLLALGVVVALLALAEYQRRAALEAAGERGELMARVLEDHATRVVESASLTLRTLAESMAQQPQVEPARQQALLTQALAGLPFLRGVAVLDAQGQVLASSSAAEQGLRLDLGRIGRPPASAREMLLPLLPGRGLADLRTDAASPRAAGVNMLPLMRRMTGPAGKEWLLLAMINPGALANYQQIALSDDDGIALLASYDGVLITTTDPALPAPGRRFAEHPVFSHWLPAREWGGYIGQGVLPGPQVVAFRVSRSRPLVVLIEQSEAAALQRWRASLPWLAGLGAGALLLIGCAATVLLRAMRARENSRQALDRAHEQVALRERELSVVLKSVQELIFRTDVDGVVTFVNAPWGAMSRRGEAGVLGRNLASMVAGADRERIAALFRPDDRAGVRGVEVSARTADGRLHRFAVSVVPLHGRGRVVGFAGSAVDVTERYVAQQKLQHQLAFTGLLLEISPLPTAMFDAQGLYVTVNQAWEDFSGLSRADVIGTEVGFALRPEELRLPAGQAARWMAQGGRQRHETRVRHRDGSLRDIVITQVLVPGERGDTAGTLCTLMDVSEFRDAERATREARDVAEEASRSKSEFVANISHELRTPLQSILGFSELGQARGCNQPRMAAGMFADIHASGQRMLALVNDLLDVSKIESSVGTFDLERCDLRGLVQSVLRELEPLVTRRRQQLVLQLPDEPLSARVDPQRFQQVIRNVTANAIKFSPEGGRIEVSAELLPPGEARISVRDRGPGIPEAEIEKVFDAFVQSSKTKDGSGGTGLGLAICRKIMTVHDGSIHAENRAGGGAVFHIQLPVRVREDTALDSLVM
ncbi:MAG: PAS domain S-box protein [Burkholderiales bacterium]|nr:PAS domain S-box protein [Burkholderiales bacterium]